MQRVHSVGTKPEMVVRRLVFGLGYRYRLHRSDLPGKPDLVFATRRKVIFVHGCFWHGHNCKSGQKRPQTNREYWEQKLERNRQRDDEHIRTLIQSGWMVLVIWECEIKYKESLLEMIVGFLGDKTNGKR